MTDFGVYVHVPFCRHRCDYCAFATFTDRDHLMTRYVEAVRADVRRACSDGMPVADTVFFGGGTPTRLAPELLMSILDEIPRTTGAEVTVECNPDDVSEEMFRIFVDRGVNRVSFGVQSMQKHVLASLGRTHDPDNVRRGVQAALRSGLDDFNLDVIYGAHGESVADWESTVRSVTELAPPHVSAYGLTVEAGTPLADRPSEHPDDDRQAEMYEVADDLLTAAGLSNYEVSNWARSGHESRHNQVYWDQGDYRGFGSAAHSHERGRRWWNVRTPDRYVEAIASDRDPRSSEEWLDDETRRIEGLQLALRTRNGVPIDAFDRADLDLLDGLVEMAEGRAVLTRRGRLMANEVSLRLR